MTGASGPLGRDSVSFRDTMQRHFSTIENALYAAEQKCKETSEKADEECNACPFHLPYNEGCMRFWFRVCIGEHVIQHDAMPGVSPVPPCQCGGDCGCRRHGE